MTRTPKNTTGQSWLRLLGRWITRVAVAVVLLLVVLLLLTQTRPFKNWLRDYAVSTANESIRGRLAIERLDGNLFTNLTLHNISITQESDTVVTVTSTHLHYSLLSLLHDVIQIDTIIVSSPRVNLIQGEDSIWNLTDLAITDTTALPADTTDEEFGYEISVIDFQVNDASVNITASDTVLPKRIYDFSTRLSARYGAGKQTINVTRLEARTEQPNLQIVNATVDIVADSVSYRLDKLTLQTALNSLNASAVIYPADLARSTARISADSLVMDEFDRFIPNNLARPLPIVSLAASLDNDSVAAEIALDRQKQQVVVSVKAGPVTTLIDSTRPEPFTYEVRSNLRNVALREWLNEPSIDAVLNGSLDIVGSGVEPNTLALSVTGNLDRCRFEKRQVNAAGFDIDYSGGTAVGSVTLDGAFGGIALSGSASNIFEDVAYRLDAALSHLDLMRLGLTDTLSTDLTASVSLSGTGTVPDSAKGEVRLSIAPSTVGSLVIDAVDASLAFGAGEIRIDTLTAVTLAAQIDVSGALSRHRQGEMAYTVVLDDISQLALMFGIDSVAGHGQLEGRVTGTLDSLVSKTALDFSDLSILSTSIARVKGDVAAEYIDSSLSADGWFEATGIASDGQLVDSVVVSGGYRDDRANVALRFAHGRGLRGETNLIAHLDSIIAIFIPRLMLEYGSVRWSGGSDSTFITVNDSTYEISDLELTAAVADSGEVQSLRIDGAIDLAGETNLQTVIHNLYLRPIASMFKQDLSGRLSADMAVNGKLSAPNVAGHLLVTDGRYELFDFSRLSGNLVYDGSTAEFDLSLVPAAPDSLTITGTVPYSVRIGDTLTPTANDSSIDIRVHTDRLSLDVLKAAGYIIEETGGHLSCDLNISNTITDPKIHGTVKISDGRVTIPTYGLGYEDIEANISLEPNRITLDSLVIMQDKGGLRMHGSADFDSGLVKGTITASRLDLVASDFWVVRHRHYEVQLGSNVNLSGTSAGASYNGELLIKRSSFYLPAMMEQTQTDTLNKATMPMLVAATWVDTVGDTTLAATVNGGSAPQDTTMPLLSNLRGNLKVTIPKNMWIRSPDLKLELAGDLEITKNGPEFELFGDIRVVRGHYQLYGKRFNVKRGVLTFQGGADYNPRLDIEAEYMFRTAAREKKKLLLLISGTAEVPIIAFRLDGADLPEGDAVSYILFGRSLDELTQGQRSSIAGGSQSGSMASGVAANLLAGQLSKALGDRLSLDVIEIKAEGDLQSAAVVVGKYLTPDLFMSYQRSFGSAADNDLEPETVTLEYQLTRLMYLQLTEGDPEEAGFDIIFKFQKE